MKPPVITVENPVVKTTTIRELIPPSPAAHAGKEPRPDYWEFVRALTDEQMGEFAIYMTREDPGRVPVDSTMTKYWEPPGYGPIWIGDQEALEMAVARVCGGGGYRLALKRRKTSEWICDVRFRIDMAPRQITPWYFSRPLPDQTHTAANGSGTGTRTYTPGDPNVQIASKAMDVLAGQEHAAVNIGIDLFKAAGDVLKNRGMNGGGLEDEVMRSLLARALNPPPPPPPPDPIELLTRVMAIQERLNPAGNGTGNPITNRILEVAVTRLLEPPANTSPIASAGDALVRTLPSLAGHVVEFAREWRMKAEVERDTVAMMQNQPRAIITPPPPTPQPQVLPATVAPRVNPTPSANPEINGEDRIIPPSIEFIEHRIGEMFRMPISPEEAAENAIEFLYTISGASATPGNTIVDNMAKRGEKGLQELFRDRPILRAATDIDPARRDAFIRAFLRLYQEEKAEDERAAANKPN